MAVRILPQWLVDLHTGKNRLVKKANGVKRRGKTEVKTESEQEHNQDVSPTEEKNEESTKLSRTANKKLAVRTDANCEQAIAGGFPNRRLKNTGKAVRIRLEISSSDDEVDVKPTLDLKVEENGKNETDVSAEVGAQDFPTCTEVKCENNSSVKDECDKNEDKLKEEDLIEASGSNENPDSTVNDCDDQLSNDTSITVNTTIISPTPTTTTISPTTTSPTTTSRTTTSPTTTSPSTTNTTTTSPSTTNTTTTSPSTTNTTTTTTTNTSRSKCKYGKKCYRKNSQHRQDYSHPGDDDYDTVDDRPECEYGLSCYRKNPLHRQHYKHTKKVQKPRKAKRQKKQDNDSGSDDDDYDLDDPFIDDASSDDYRPSDSSETDFSAEEANSASDDDTHQTDKNSNKLQRKRKH